MQTGNKLQLRLAAATASLALLWAQPAAAQTIGPPPSSASGTPCTGDFCAATAPLSGTLGGTGVANSGSTITLGGNLATSGAHALTLTTTADTNVTLPTSGTLLNGAAGTVPLTALATQSTNTVVGNATSGSASPTALAVGSCSSSSSALNWTTNTGFGCNTSINAASLGGATFAAPGAIGGGTPAAGTFTTVTPGQTTGIVGTTTNNSAQAGSVGEYISSTILRASAITITTTGTAQDITSISLTAGDWDISGIGYFIGASGTTVSRLLVYANTSTNTLNQTSGFSGNFVNAPFVAANYGDPSATLPRIRYSLSGPTTIYLGGFADFAVSTAQFYGSISARRIR